MADISITASSVTPVTNAGLNNAQTATFTAGVAVAAGEWCYVVESTGKLALADADLSDAAAVVKGMALNSAAADQKVTLAVKGRVNVGSVLTIGKVYVLSSNAGKTAPVADLGANDRTSIVGVAYSASVLDIRIFNSGVTNAA